MPSQAATIISRSPPDAAGTAVLKGAIFDLGETLIHLAASPEQIEEARARAIYDALRETGATVDFDYLKQKYVALSQEESDRAARTLEEDVMEESLPRFLDKLGVSEEHRPPVFDLVKRFFALEAGSWTLFPGVHEMLAEVRASGLKMGLLSNARSSWAINEIATRLDMAGYFDAIVTSAGVGFRKPRPEPFQEMLRELKLSPGEAVMIGNSIEADISGAKCLGVKTIHVIYGSAPQEKGAEPDITVYKVSDIPLAIKRIAVNA